MAAGIGPSQRGIELHFQRSASPGHRDSTGNPHQPHGVCAGPHCAARAHTSQPFPTLPAHRWDNDFARRCTGTAMLSVDFSIVCATLKNRVEAGSNSSGKPGMDNHPAKDPAITPVMGAWGIRKRRHGRHADNRDQTCVRHGVRTNTAGPQVSLQGPKDSASCRPHDSHVPVDQVGDTLLQNAGSNLRADEDALYNVTEYKVAEYEVAGVKHGRDKHAAANMTKVHMTKVHMSKANTAEANTAEVSIAKAKRSRGDCGGPAACMNRVSSAGLPLQNDR